MYVQNVDTELRHGQAGALPAGTGAPLIMRKIRDLAITVLKDMKNR